MDLRLFALNASRDPGGRIAALLRIALADQVPPFRLDTRVAIEKLKVVLCHERVLVLWGHDAVPEMEEGPPKPACRRRLQTAVSCCSRKRCGGERYG
jgi:hypothetical protein